MVPTSTTSTSALWARPRVTQSAAMLPRPENTSIPVSTRAKPEVRSFSHRLAFSIRKISMNRKPRPNAGKYTIGRSTPVSGRRSRPGAANGTSSTRTAITTACTSTARLTSAPISACGRISSRFRMVSS